MLKAFKDALDAGHIEPALLPDGTPFVEEGVTFYQSSNQGINMLMGRFHAFSDTLRRHDSLKLNDELLTTALDTIETLARRIRAQANADTEQVLDANEEILLVVKRIKQRRELGLEISQVYDIASLWFFAEDEHPGMPEPVKTRRNQQLWLNSTRSAELYAFFLNTPLNRYVPLQSLSDPSTLNSMRVNNETDMLDWALTSTKLRMIGENPATISTIESLRETLAGYNILLSRL